MYREVWSGTISEFDLLTGCVATLPVAFGVARRKDDVPLVLQIYEDFGVAWKSWCMIRINLFFLKKKKKKT